MQAPSVRWLRDLSKTDLAKNFSLPSTDLECLLWPATCETTSCLRMVQEIREFADALNCDQATAGSTNSGD